MVVQALIENVKRKNVDVCYAAPVGEIGDPVVRPRVRQSAPWLPWAYDPYWTVPRATKLMGANVQNGGEPSLVRKTLGAHTVDANWVGNRTAKHQYGWSMTSVQIPDKLKDPVLRSLGRSSWESKLARTTIAKRAGKLFSVLPYGYQPKPGDVLRGGNFPTVTEVSGGTNPPAGTRGVMLEKEDVVTGGDDDVNMGPASPVSPTGSLRAGFSRLGFQNVGMRRQFENMRI